MTGNPRSSAFRARARCACLAASLLAGACGTPTVDTAVRGEPALVAIEAALVEAVDWARDDPQREWTHGWTGNAAVHVDEEATAGLCYQWQELVWDTARPVALRQGWLADGIAINQDTWSAHYAVVVWDPDRIARAELLAAPATSPAFVLDAWRNGEPEIYTIADWIDIPIWIMTDPELEDLHAEYGDEPRYGPRAGSRSR